MLVWSIKYVVTITKAFTYSYNQIYNWTIFSRAATRFRMKMYISEK